MYREFGQTSRTAAHIKKQLTVETETLGTITNITTLASAMTSKTPVMTETFIPGMQKTILLAKY